MGSVCYGVLTALGEMTAFLPHKRGFAGHASRFVDDSFGFALGWNYLFKYLVIVPSQLNATAILISYWRPDLSGAIWITIFAVAIMVINIWGGIRVFGEIEFWLSFIKIVVLVGLLILSICINAGATPRGEYLGFKYWQDGRAFSEYLTTGALGRFAGTWSAMVLALFAYTGTELAAVTAGEAKNPRKTLPAAIRSTFYRILFFYILLILLVSTIVPADSPLLVSASKGKSTAAASPFVIAIQVAGIKALPGILNGCFLVFTYSAAQSDLYIASRTLYGLAKSGQAPALFKRCDKSGTPWVALVACSCFIALAYINVASGGSKAFGYLTSTVTIFGGLTWWALLITHLRLMAGFKAQGIDRNSLPYKSPFQPYFGYWSLLVITLVLIFKGFAAFVGQFDYRCFITNYIGAPIFLALFVGWKFAHKTRFVSASHMDLVTGVRDLDGELADAAEDEGDEESLSARQKVLRFVKTF